MQYQLCQRQKAAEKPLRTTRAVTPGFSCTRYVTRSGVFPGAASTAREVRNAAAAEKSEAPNLSENPSTSSRPGSWAVPHASAAAERESGGEARQ